MFLEHNSNIVLEILDIIMLCKHNVTEAYFIGAYAVQMTSDNDDFWQDVSNLKREYSL